MVIESDLANNPKPIVGIGKIKADVKAFVASQFGESGMPKGTMLDTFLKKLEEYPLAPLVALFPAIQLIAMNQTSEVETVTAGTEIETAETIEVGNEEIPARMVWRAIGRDAQKNAIRFEWSLDANENLLAKATALRVAAINADVRKRQGEEAVQRAGGDIVMANRTGFALISLNLRMAPRSKLRKHTSRNLGNLLAILVRKSLESNPGTNSY